MAGADIRQEFANLGEAESLDILVAHVPSGFLKQEAPVAEGLFRELPHFIVGKPVVCEVL